MKLCVQDIPRTMHWPIDLYKEEGMDTKVLGMTRVNITNLVYTDSILCSYRLNAPTFLPILEAFFYNITLFNKSKSFLLFLTSTENEKETLVTGNKK